jgi:hypothetical protein
MTTRDKRGGAWEQVERPKYCKGEPEKTTKNLSG